MPRRSIIRKGERRCRPSTLSAMDFPSRRERTAAAVCGIGTLRSARKGLLRLSVCGRYCSRGGAIFGPPECRIYDVPRRLPTLSSAAGFPSSSRTWLVRISRRMRHGGLPWPRPKTRRPRWRESTAFGRGLCPSSSRIGGGCCSPSKSWSVHCRSSGVRSL